MKKTILLSLLCFLLTGCGNASSSESGETWYLNRIMFYDENSNFLGFYNAEQIGSEESTLFIGDAGRVEYTFYYHNEEKEKRRGSISESEEGQKDQQIVLFEGDGNKNILMKDGEEDNETMLLTYKYDDTHFAGASFKKEKKEKYNDTLKNIELPDKEDFLESEIYRSVIASLAKGGTKYTADYDRENNIFLIRYYPPSGLASALRSSSEEIGSTFEQLCGSLLDISKNVAASIHVGGYKQITCRVELVNDEDETASLFRADNGEEVYKYKYGNTASSQTPSGNSPSSSGSSSSGNTSSNVDKGFEGSESYNEIRRICLDSFYENNPKMKYDASKNTFTLTLEAPNGTHEEVDAQNMGVLMAWYDWTASLSNVSAGGYQLMSKDGYSNIAFIIMVSSDKDPSKCLYATMNGEDYYNFASQ